MIGAGFSVSGFKTGRAGTYVAPIPLSDWSNRDLGREIMAALGLPVCLENNATAGAIGEAMVGVGLEHDTFAYLSFNYGFGGGIVVVAQHWRAVSAMPAKWAQSTHRKNSPIARRSAN